MERQRTIAVTGWAHCQRQVAFLHHFIPVQTVKWCSALQSGHTKCVHYGLRIQAVKDFTFPVILNTLGDRLREFAKSVRT